MSTFRDRNRNTSSKRLLVLIFAILIVDGIIGSLVYPVLPDFFRTSHNPELLFGLSTVIFALMQMLFAPVLGALSDARGRAPIFRVAAVGTALSMLLLLPVTVPLLLVNRFSDGATNGLYAVIKSAIVDVSEPDDVPRNVGLSLSLSYVGFLVGPGLAAVVLSLAEGFGWNSTRSLIITGICFAAVNVALSFGLPETRPNARPSAETSSQFNLVAAIRSASPVQLVKRIGRLRTVQPDLFLLLSLHALVILSIGYYSYFVIFAARSPIALDGRGIAFLFLYFALLGVISNTVFFARVLSRVAPLPTVRTLLLCGFAVLVSYGLFAGSSLIAMYVLLTIDMLTISLVPAVMEGLIGQHANESQRGEVFGLSQSIASMMGVISAILATVLSTIDLRFPFFAFACAAAVAAVVSFRVHGPALRPRAE